jgi:hypothetical protein
MVLTALMFEEVGRGFVIKNGLFRWQLSGWVGLVTAMATVTVLYTIYW